jgi:hypothetical protein
MFHAPAGGVIAGIRASGFMDLWHAKELGGDARGGLCLRWAFTEAG